MALFGQDTPPPTNGGYWAAVAGIVMAMLGGATTAWQAIRNTKKAERIDVVKEWQDYCQRLRLDLDEARKEVHDLRNELSTKVTDLYAKHAVCEAQRAELQADFEAYKRQHP